MPSCCTITLRFLASLCRFTIHSVPLTSAGVLLLFTCCRYRRAAVPSLVVFPSLCPFVHQGCLLLFLPTCCRRCHAACTIDGFLSPLCTLNLTLSLPSIDLSFAIAHCSRTAGAAMLLRHHWTVFVLTPPHQACYAPVTNILVCSQCSSAAGAATLLYQNSAIVAEAAKQAAIANTMAR